ncbi:MAG: hypothetical protein FWG68_12085 [Defluviitaleaceae bacterium]|nr:hypothetical protein [Defluviitaleaceae bacterium]
MINKALLKEQLKRFWIFSAFFVVGYILAGIVPLHVINAPDAAWREMSQIRALLNILEMRNITIVFTVFMPFVAIMAFYPYYVSVRAATAFYSFPISKHGLFCTNFVAALILTLAPLLVFCLLLLVPISYNGPIFIHDDWTEIILFNPQIFPRFYQEPLGVINTIPVVAGFFMRTALGIIFYLSVFLVAISLSGNKFVSMLFCGALPLVPMAVHGFVNLLGNIFVFGFDSQTAAFRLFTTATFTNPVMLGEHLSPVPVNVTNGNWQLWHFLLAYAVIIVIMLAFAYVFGNLRKIEKVGESVISDKFKKVCVFLFSFCGAVLLAIIMGQAFLSIPMLYVGAILGFLIAYLVGQMIAEQSFAIMSKIKSLPYYGGIMLGISAAIWAFITYGLFVYVHTVPNLQDIHGVIISEQWSPPGGELLADWEIIDATIGVHQQIIINRRELVQAGQTFEFSGFTEHNNDSIRITYILHDGSELTRTYRFGRAFAEESGIQALRSTPQVLIARSWNVGEVPEMEALVLHLSERLEVHDLVTFHTTQTLAITNPAHIAEIVPLIQQDWLATAIADRNDQRNLEEQRAEDGVWQHFLDISANMTTNNQVNWFPTLDFGRSPLTVGWLLEMGYLE